MRSKVSLGQFYTKANPFNHCLVKEWFSLIPENAVFCEPFAGCNSLVKSFSSVFGVPYSHWCAFDIAPESLGENLVPEVKICYRDSIKNPVRDVDVIITNPPYLAKNSASRKKLNVDFGGFSDLYELCLSKMLDNTSFVAAIIPESFLSKHLFRDRLYGFISVGNKIFDDTEFPVGIGLWVDSKQTDYKIFVNDAFVGFWSDISFRVDNFWGFLPDREIKFNDPHGIIGLSAVDNSKTASIFFTVGDFMPSYDVKISSRSKTRISVDGISLDNRDDFLGKCNSILSDYRKLTCDVGLTSFKGLRSDGFYRRRLDWDVARKIMLKASFDVLGDKDCKGLLWDVL